MESSGVQIGRRQDIQYLRAVAVILVVLYHLPARWNLEGGYLGVDIFFVISGYVITKSLIEGNHRSLSLLGTYYSFMRRRVRRLVPPLTSAIMGGLALTFLFAPVSQFRGVLDTSWFSATFTGNFYFVRHFDTYWNPEILRNPLLHLWSLGVEFQVYLLWPLLVTKRQDRLSVRRFVLVGATIFSFALFIYFLVFARTDLLGMATKGIAFYSPVTRLWQLGLGGVVYLYGEGSIAAKLQRIPLRASGVALIFVSVVQSTRSSGLSLWVIAGCLGAAVVLLVDESTEESRLLAPLGWIGDRSYSIYLWHWPLLATALWTHPGSLGWSTLAVVMAIPIASLSYRFLELRSPAKRIHRTKIVFFCLSLLVLVAAAVTVSNSEWFNKTRTPAEVAMQFPDNGPTGEDMMAAASNCVSVAGDKWMECNNFTDTDDRIMIIGDSLGYRSIPAINFWARARGYNTTMMWTGGCSFAKNSCTAEIGNQVYDYLTRHRIAAIFEAANFDRPADRVNASEKAAGLLPKCSGPTVTCVEHLAWVKEFEAEAEPGLAQLEMSTKNIIVSLPFPQQAEFVESCLQLPMYKRILRSTLTESCGRTSVAWQAARQGLIPETIRRAVSSHPNVRLWDPRDAFCLDGWCPAVVNSGERIMDDAVHWSWPAARLMVPHLSKVLDSFGLPDINHPTAD